MHEFDKCLIFTVTGKDAVNGFVHEFNDGVMKVYTQGASPVSIVPMTDVNINVYNSVKGECKYAGTVDKTSFNNIELVNVRLVSSVQKRDNTRVNKQLKYKIHSFIKDGEKVKVDKPVDITVLNISAKGLYFNSEERFEAGTKFQLYFRETPRTISLNIEVIRREEFSHSYNYGCAFIDISEKDMDEIFRFVLKEQIAQRRKNFLFK